MRLLTEAGYSFVIADPGEPLRWVPARERFDFWKMELKGRLVAPEVKGFRLEDFPNCYCYVATEWRIKANRSVILLEKHH